MYDFLPVGERSYMYTRCKELFALRERAHSLEARVADLEDIRKTERYIDETYRDIVLKSHLQSGSIPVAMEERGHVTGEHHPGVAGSDPVTRTCPPGDVKPSRTEEASPGPCAHEGRVRTAVIVGDSIIRHVDSWVAGGREDRLVTCLPGAKVADLTRHLDKVLDSAGEESAVLVHVGTNDIGKCGRRGSGG